MAICYTCECEDKHYCKGFCIYHYQKMRLIDYPENYRLASKRYYIKNRDKIFQAQGVYMRTPKAILYAHEYRNKNRKKRRKYDTLRRLRAKEDILKILGKICIRCGFSDIRALQIDHVNGGGTKEKKLIKNDVKRYKFMLINIEKYQILCANCNWIKRYENGEVRKNNY